jgi:transglutaminase-like putative cysteine protease
MHIKEENNQLIRWWDLPAAALLSIALLIAATRLVSTQWTDHLSLTQFLVIIGVGLGFAVGQSRFPPPLGTILAASYGLIVVPWLLGVLLEKNQAWSVRLPILLSRANDVLSHLTENQPVRDPILFLLLMGILFWILSVNAGYTLTRYGNAWAALLPSGLVLFTIHSFDRFVSNRIWFIAVFILVSLIIIARIAYLHQLSRWDQKQMSLPPNIGLNIIRYAFLWGTTIVLLSWILPVLASSVPGFQYAARPINNSWVSLRTSFENAFYSLQSSVGMFDDGYGISTQLGHGNHLTDAPIFSVRTLQDQPGSTRFYWRARIYDSYSKGRWISTITDLERYYPWEKTETFTLGAGRLLRNFQITAQSTLSTMYSPSQPIFMNREGYVDTIHYPIGELEFARFRADSPLTSGDTYEVQALVSYATDNQLRSAGTNYPAHIEENYLQLPATITTRTIQLAQNITDGIDNPYNKTLAITNYLREEITYQDSIPSIPEGKEPIDWFLFEYKKGFCNYYSTAEIILLRSIGIPARWAIGYVQGEKLVDGSYQVRERNAHSWPEVYFPDYGWVEFEPTSSQSMIVRQTSDDFLDSLFDDQVSASMLRDEANRLRLLQENLKLQQEKLISRQSNKRIALNRFLLILSWFLIVVSLGILFLFKYKDHEYIKLILVKLIEFMLDNGIKPPKFLVLWAHNAGMSSLTNSFIEINYALKRLGQTVSVDKTASERAEILSRVEPLMTKQAIKLVEEYQVGTFSRQEADLSGARAAAKSIRRISYITRLRRLFS